MPRLPAALEPAFPLVKRAHRAATRSTGRATRRLAAASPGPRRLPATGTESSLLTARLEPDAVTYHPAGPAQHVDRGVAVGWPADHPVFRARRTSDVPARFVLDIADGTVVGTYAAHITPGGILDYETSDYFGIKGWKEHPLYLRPRLPEAEYVDGTVASLGTRGTYGNYYHALFDMIPRWGILQDAMPGVVPDVLYANRNTRFSRELLEMIGLGDVPALEPTKHACYRARRLLVPSQPNYGNTAPPDTIDWLRTHLPATRRTDLPKRIYVSRGAGRNTRRVNNEDEVLAVLKPLGFEVFDPGAVSVREQHDQFATAEAIVAPHGAALTNLVFASPGAKVLEFFAPRYVETVYWAITSQLPDVTYRYLLGRPYDTRPAGAPMDRVMEDITVDLDDLRIALEDLGLH
ncbi:glycosyltransferase family 61 protein [Nocardioides jiangxiensis]|uniref:Glycosyltransferase family 61 protein n=1 Tax=Nocardioides jiangxiensis TaxID=3064524 RepID=A0ABT9AZH4_9ACTN|nr:glycosyltransferase family 61 protein [Nocardioides sp. WY-20]MDO7867847.1 glycosyltransferase family 61 protein [Nocardioides sp. WY-20]